MMVRVALAVAIAACGEPHVARSPAPIVLAPCAVKGVAEKLQCGTLDVPEDRAHPEGRRLKLPVIVLPAAGRRDRGVPLFEVQGGPGVAATTAAAAFANEVAALRTVGDIVLVDQRGTGDGPSGLACPELDDVPPTVVAGVDAVRTCRTALEARADLRFYGSVDAARDLDDARRALGYDRINLEAISYGTRVAQVYMRMYPDRVNAAVFAGMLAMDVHLPAEFAENAQRVTDEIVEACSREPDCARAYPMLREQLATLATPNGIDRAAFTEWVRHRIYSAAGAAALPRIIAGAAGGDFASFTSAHGQPGFFREALLLSVTCSEDLPAIELPRAAARANATWFGSGRLDTQRAACERWPRVPVSASFYEPVTSDASVLVFAGGRDPVTPAAYATRATQRMRHATVVVVPQMGHLPDGLVGSDCIDRIELAFLRDPAKPIDTSCVATTAAPKFVLPP